MNSVLVYSAILTIASLQVWAQAAPPCTFTSGGKTYDFTKLAGKDIRSGSLYMNICGTSSTTCPKDKSGVTSGMAVVKNSLYCNVQGQYGDMAKWSLLTDGRTGVKLFMDNGSSDDCPQQRQLTVNFICGTTEEDPNFTFKDVSCKTDVTYKTCLACAAGCSGGPVGPPVPVPANAVRAVYQGKCGLAQVGMKLAFAKDPAVQKKILDIGKAHMDNLVSSCNKQCKMTAPNIAKFMAPQKPGRRSLLQQMLDTTNGGGVTPSTIPAFIPSTPCNCDVKPLSNDQVSYLTKEATAAAGEPMKMCRMHLTMTKLDGTGNTGTIKNFLPLPYLQGCGSDILNDQIEVAATAVCMFSSSTDVACKSVIECDVVIVALLMYGAHTAGKRGILVPQSEKHANLEGTSYVPLPGGDGAPGEHQT
eukprot:g8065.t1